MGNTAELQTNEVQEKKIYTSRFGEIEIDEGKLITMTSPFLGFPDERLFVLLPHGPNVPFFWLQSIENPDLAFIVISPDLLNPKYKPAMSSAVKEELQISKDQDLAVMVILTIPPGKPREMTANLLGPVVLNAEKRLAKQVVLDPRKYDTCWPVPME